jgi:hypothetical protein
MSIPSPVAPNLTERPPRSPRVRLGGYVILARMLDKGRATLAGNAGEYEYNRPMDKHVDESGFQWMDKNWQSPPLASAIIYELHLGTFTPEGTFFL